MSSWQTFLHSQQASGLAEGGDPSADHRTITQRVAIVDRSYRALLEATGRDRASWLHNLTTNQIKNLGRNEGVYAFALNNQGRILFDLNVINTADSLWLDMDERFHAVALKHLNKYIITEEVTLRDRTSEVVRIGLCGPGAAASLQSLGAPNARTMAALSLAPVRWRNVTIPMIRHDFCGVFGVELFVPADTAPELWKDLTSTSRSDHAVPVAEDAIQIRRIEAGIPWPGFEITDEYLPAETRHLDRAVSYTKGCYLGQEVVERMRSRHVVARLLTALHIDGDVVSPPGARLYTDANQAVGVLTSSCHSIALNRVIGLGYVKASSASPGTNVQLAWDELDGPHTTKAKVVELPSASA